MADPSTSGPSVTDWIMALASIATLTAVWLQYQMWKQAKRQNDLLSKPRLRLKHHISEQPDPGTRFSSDTERRLRRSQQEVFREVVDCRAADIEDEWKTHLQSQANLAAIPDFQIGFLVENIGGALATAFTINVEITVAGNPDDMTIEPKSYRREHKIEMDIPSNTQLFVVLLGGRYVFSANLEATISAVEDSLGITEEFKAKQSQPIGLNAFVNEPLKNTLATRNPKALE